MEDYRLKDIEDAHDTHRQLRERIDELREELFELRQERSYNEHKEKMRRDNMLFYLQCMAGIVCVVLIVLITNTLLS